MEQRKERFHWAASDMVSKVLLLGEDKIIENKENFEDRENCEDHDPCAIHTDISMICAFKNQCHHKATGNYTFYCMVTHFKENV